MPRSPSRGGDDREGERQRHRAEPRDRQRRRRGEQPRDVVAHAESSEHALDRPRARGVERDPRPPPRLALQSRSRATQAADRRPGSPRSRRRAPRPSTRARRRRRRSRRPQAARVRRAAFMPSPFEAATRARIARVLTVPAGMPEQARRLARREAVEDRRLHDGAQLGRQPVQRAGEVAVLDAEQHLLLGGRLGLRRARRTGTRAAGGAAARRSGGGSRCPRSTRRRRRRRGSGRPSARRRRTCPARRRRRRRHRRSAAPDAASATARGARRARAAPRGRRRRPRRRATRRCGSRSGRRS